MLLKSKWVNDVFKGKSERTSRQRKIETRLSKIYGTKKKKSVLRGNFIVMQAYLKKQEKI